MVNDRDEELLSFAEAYYRNVRDLTEDILYERFNKLLESDDKICVVGFGRLNPP